MKSDKYYLFCISMIKSPKKLHQLYEVIIIMEENMIVIRHPKTFCFNFDWPKNFDENLKHEAEFVIKSNESLAEIIINNQIDQLLLKHEKFS